MVQKFVNKQKRHLIGFRTFSFNNFGHSVSEESLEGAYNEVSTFSEFVKFSKVAW